AEQGIAEAQANLGVAYAGGLGVKKDLAEAVRWSSKAAQKDIVLGQETLRTLAEQGYAAAQFNLGRMYAGGHGIRQSDFEAYKWFARAAAQGNPDARKQLAALAKRLSAEQIAEAQRAAKQPATAR